MIVGAPRGLRFTNTILMTVAVLLALYIVGAPFLPDASFRLASLWNTLTGKGQTGSVEVVAPGSPDKAAIPQDNRLVIPEIGVDGGVFEGNGAAALAKGIWHRPKTSTPDKGGNTVLVAHRFLYTFGPNTFYHLDKVKVGDEFTLFWSGKEYDYRVTETKVVPPTAVEIEKNTSDPILTLYTCTPLLTGTDRLVVIAKPIN